ncbi:MAG: diguanylate cyclase, partial [Oscillospiraceae bacterium]
IGVVKSDGEAIIGNDDQIYSLVDRDFFQRAILGENVISDIYTRGNDNTRSIVMAVPITKGNNTLGVLYSSYDATAIDELFDSKILFGGEGNTTIIKNNGAVISSSVEKVVNSPSYFEYLENGKFLDDFSVKAFKENLSKNEDGIFHFFDGEKKKYIGYFAINNVSDWYMLVSAPDSIIETQISSISKLGIMLVIESCTILIIFALIFGWEQRNNMKKIRESENELKAVSGNIPGGVQKCLWDDNFTISYASNGFYKLTGYSATEIDRLFSNEYIKLILNIDRDCYVTSLNKQLKEQSQYEIEYRIKNKSGKTTWILEKGQLVLDKGENILYRVLIDNTASKTTQQELEISQNRYKAIMERTDSIIYEWNLLDDTVFFSDVWEKTFGYPPVKKNLVESLFKEDIVFIDDREVYLELVGRVKQGSPYETGYVRVRKGDKSEGHYVWRKVSLMAICDKNNVPCRAIGISIDVDKERRETADLQERAQLDALTKIYNKGTAENMIKDFLIGDGSNGKHVLMIIDIDNFKGINDNLGHLVGDEVLHNVAANIKALFRSSDIVGRIGGDEFIVLMKNISSEKLAKDKAAEICDSFHSYYIDNGEKYKISGSIGGAIFSKDATEYCDLFKKADIALYYAKNNGKDTFCLYNVSQKGLSSGLYSKT